MEQKLLEEALAVVRAALDELGEPAGVSAAELLDGLAIGDGAREAILARVEVSSATTGDTVDASELGGLAAHSDAPAPSVAGGNQHIALELARGLGPSVRLSSAVRRIVWDETGARVAVDDDVVEADRVVLAVPATVLDAIAFDPALPDSLRAAYAGVEYGHAAKLFVPLLRDAPTSAVLSVPERYWTWTATAGTDEVQRVAHAFAGSTPALERLGVAGGADAWVASLARLRPDLDLDPDGAVLSTWDDDAWAAAAYSHATPPVDAWAPSGVFHACGEHTAGARAALMDGALGSGLRVAEEVLTALAARSSHG